MCPGFHDAALTDSFVRSLPAFVTAHISHTFPTDAIALLPTLRSVFQNQPVVAIGFSAGAVGLISAAVLFQSQGHRIDQIIAIDGWGVPSLGLPICRISHDAFTHWSSLPLGIGQENFYAEPAVDHLSLWESPAQASGWIIEQVDPSWPFSGGMRTADAATFLHAQLEESYRRLYADASFS